MFKPIIQQVSPLFFIPRKIIPVLFALAIPALLPAQTQQAKSGSFHGMYFQWGYNIEMYSKSDIHFKMSNGDNFTLHSAKAHHSPDFDAIIKDPLQISIPQYNYRLGFYLNKQKTKAVELNSLPAISR